MLRGLNTYYTKIVQTRPHRPFKISGLLTKMGFKQRYKLLKNEKINFIKVTLIREILLFQNIFISFYPILYSESDFDSNKKKTKCTRSLKQTCHPHI